jgi:cytochrome c-type biogenesis protein CcmF
LQRGQTLQVENYQVKYDSLAIFDTSEGSNVARAVVDVGQNGSKIGEIYPRVDYYYDTQQQIKIPGLHSTLKGDLYVLLVDWESFSFDTATFKIYYNPLVPWLWIGSLIFILGILVAAWPARSRSANNNG